MKKHIIFLAAFLLLSLSYNSCKEENANLAVSLTSLGYNNTHIGYLGGMLGVNAGIIAEKKIENISVSVIIENGNSKFGDNAFEIISAWTFDSVYTDKYSGETEVTFIEELIIPMDADTGSYVLSIKVKDNKGNEISVQDDFRLDYGK
jgi:hypothetical protein